MNKNGNGNENKDELHTNVGRAFIGGMVSGIAFTAAIFFAYVLLIA